MTLQFHDARELRQSADRLTYARQIIRAEAEALTQVADRLDDSFLKAVDLIYQCPGRIAVTGTGKSADVGQKIAGTLNSTGTRAYVLDSTRAVHGDLGMVHPNDIIMALSHSGESEEITRLLEPFRQLAFAVIGITSNAAGTLAKKSDVALILGPIEEACPLGLAPSTSTTAMIAVGDALAFTLTQMRQFTREDFARYHPAGSLGRKLLRVDALMRKDDDFRCAPDTDTVRDVFSRDDNRGRRTGAVILTDANGALSGIFTDSDLARLFQLRQDQALDCPIAQVMTRNPVTVASGARVADAVEIVCKHKISELPVVDGQGKPIGLLDITDLIGLIPKDMAEELARVA